jgi:hypothetical protein
VIARFLCCLVLQGEQIAVEHAAHDTRSDNVALGVDRCGPRKRSAWQINRADLPGAQQTAMACSSRIPVGVDNVGTRVISQRIGQRRARGSRLVCCSPVSFEEGICGGVQPAEFGVLLGGCVITPRFVSLLRGSCDRAPLLLQWQLATRSIARLAHNLNGDYGS